MFPYWTLFTLSAVGAIQYRANQAGERQGGPLLMLLALLTMLMIGLRFEVGGDWGTYLLVFEHTRYLDLVDALSTQDPGYAFLNWLGQRIGAGIWFVNTACALLFTWGLTSFARRQPNPWMAFVVAVPYLIIVVAMGYTRQAVAIGFVLAALSRIQVRPSLLTFSVFIIFAALFHKSAIVVLPLVAFSFTRNRILTILIAAVLGAALYYAFVEASMDRLLLNYEEQDYDSQGATVRVLLNIVPGLMFLLMQKRFSFSDFDRVLWRNFSLAALASLVMLYLVQSSTAVDRLALYLVPLQIAVLSRLPSVLSRQATPSGPAILTVIAYAALIQFVWLNYATHAQLWLPYRVVLSTGV